MRRATFIASVLAVAGSSTVSGVLPVSIQSPALAQAPAEPVPTPAPEAPPAMEPAPEAGAEAEKAPAEPPPLGIAPPPAAIPSETPTPTSPPSVPVPFVVPPTEYVIPEQGEFGPLIRVMPAHRVAMMEAGQTIPETDALTTQAAVLLVQLTGQYLEDAPRIAELTIKTCATIRLSKGAASPFELMQAAIHAKRPAPAKPPRPRQYDKFAAAYLKARVKEGKDHAGAIAEIQGAPVAPPAPR